MPYAIIRRAGAVAALLLASLTGCLDSTGVDEEEPDIHGVVLSANLGGTASGSTTVLLGSQPTNTLTLRANSANALTVKVLGGDLNDEPTVMIHSADFEIRLLQNDVPVTSTIDGGYPYAFTVTPTSAPGTYSFEVQVRSLDHDHTEFTTTAQITIVAGP